MLTFFAAWTRSGVRSGVPLLVIAPMRRRISLTDAGDKSHRFARLAVHEVKCSKTSRLVQWISTSRAGAH